MIFQTAIERKIHEIDGKAWSPVEVARVNDQILRIALFDGEFHWHKHEHEDELFFVYSGHIVIQVKDSPDIILKAGEIAVIPKGVEHCSKSIEPSYVLMFEPEATISKGN